jgi:hypothetical protein
MAMSSDETTIDLAELDPFDPGSASAPVRHRRGLKRSSAACRRCRQRKQKVEEELRYLILGYTDFALNSVMASIPAVEHVSQPVLPAYLLNV